MGKVPCWNRKSASRREMLPRHTWSYSVRARRALVTCDVSRRRRRAGAALQSDVSVHTRSFRRGLECSHRTGAILGHHVGHQSLKLCNLLAPGAIDRAYPERRVRVVFDDQLGWPTAIGH